MFNKDDEDIVETKNKEQISYVTINKFYNMANELNLSAKDKIHECNTVLIYLEKNVMDENEEDLDNENNRKIMRPLTNELMNQIKMSRNLMKLLLQDIHLVQTKNTEISGRLIERFINVCGEVSSINVKIKELAVEFNSKFADFLKKGSSDPLAIKSIST
jgi:hypothetical protein